jgi:hypothetical protein
MKTVRKLWHRFWTVDVHEKVPPMTPTPELVEMLQNLPDARQQELMARALLEIQGYATANANRINKIRTTVQRMYRTNTVGIFALAIVLVVVGVFSIRVTIDQSHEPHRLAKAIQTSRYDATYSSCVQSNNRHDKAVAFIHTVLIGTLGKHATPAKKKAAQIGAQEFDTLITDLAPVRPDCRAYAMHQIRLPIH